jgi:hypothetical protein
MRDTVFKSRKTVGKCEEAVKNKGIASSSNQKCKVYKTFNIIIVVLQNEPKFSPGSAIRCYVCGSDDCTDPYSPKSGHEYNCESQWNCCLKISANTGKWLHNRHFNIYIRQLNKISQNI